MFSKIIGLFMSALMFIASLLGINVGKENKDMISYGLANKTVSVSVSENGSTGYKWNCKIKNEKVAKLAADKYEYSAPADLVGAAGTRTFTFKGVSEGETYIYLTYERSWEKLAGRTIIINLKVSADKTLEAKLISDISSY